MIDDECCFHTSGCLSTATDIGATNGVDCISLFKVFRQDGSVDKTRKAAILFGVAVESLVHLVWRNEEIIKRGREKEYPDLQMKVREYNERIIEAMRLVEEVKQR